MAALIGDYADKPPKKVDIVNKKANNDNKNADKKDMKNVNKNQDNTDQKNDNLATSNKINPIVDDNKSNSPDTGKYLILMGDSCLDNFYNLINKKEQNITSLLRQKYINSANIINLAVESCQSRHVIYGVLPSAQCVSERIKYGIDDYPIDENDGRVYPTAILEEMLTTNQIIASQSTVILSVGMSDLKSLLPISDESVIVISMLSFAKNLNEILNILTKQYFLNKIILISLWEPYSEFYTIYETPRDAFTMVLNLWMNKLFDIAQTHKLPVIDLTRTLYTYDRSHYGNSIFENSDKSSGFITELIDKVLNDSSIATNTQSIIYYSSSAFGGIQTEINNQSARINYIKNIQTMNAFKNIVNNTDQQDYKDQKMNDDDKKDAKPVKPVTPTVPATSVVGKSTAVMVAAPAVVPAVVPVQVKPVATHIILMGDSVLDNFYWLADKKKDVKQQLLDTYKNKIKVTNLAVDESTSEDVLYGMDPSWQYIDARKDEGLDPYPVDKDDNDKVNPLKIAKKMIDSAEINVNIDVNKQIKATVVLSIGGNDVRVLLYDFSLDKIMKGLAEFDKNARTIVEKILFDLQLNVIFVICYEPYSDFAPSYGLQREQLLQVFNIGVNKIFTLCETYSIPIIDLSRTFNPFDRSHYGSTSIEPSNKSGQFIVDLIKHINDNFEFHSNTKTSKIYYGTKATGIIEKENNQKAKDEYLPQLLSIKKQNK